MIHREKLMRAKKSDAAGQLKSGGVRWRRKSGGVRWRRPRELIPVARTPPRAKGLGNESVDVLSACCSLSVKELCG